MTKEETDKIRQMMSDGIGYRAIATFLGMPVNSVKSWCRRHPIIKEEYCLWCGNTIQQTPHKRMKKFCSDKCRYRWWSKHPEHRISEKPYKHICINCGNSFSTSRKESKYCSVSCFAEIRRGDTNDWRFAYESIRL